MSETCQRQDCDNTATVVPLILFWAKVMPVETRNEQNCGRFVLDLAICSECASNYQHIDEYMHADGHDQWAKTLENIGYAPPDTDALIVTFQPLAG